MDKISIVSPSRLHLTLIDLNAEIGRVDGGVGITLDSPVLKLSAEKADSVEVLGDSGLTEKIRSSALALLPEGEGISILVEEDYPDHVGFGSGTQAALSAGKAVNELYGLGKSVTEIAIAANRGTTSGIGVAAFERGGFLLDGGHRFRDKKTFSHDVKGVPPGLLLSRYEFPDWPIVVAVPNGQGVHDDKEINVFNTTCPIPLSEVRELSHVLLMHLLPALIEEDPEGFGAAVNHIQTVGFKRREVDLQPAAQDVMAFMRGNGCYGAGMSSFGPLVYGLVDNSREAAQVRNEVQRMLDESAGGTVLLTKARNKGADIVFADAGSSEAESDSLLCF